MESLFIPFQMMYKLQFQKIDHYDWFCGPVSQMIEWKCEYVYESMSEPYR